MPNLSKLGFHENKKEEFKSITGLQLFFRNHDNKNSEWIQMTHDFLPNLKGAFTGEKTFSEIWNSNYDNKTKNTFGKFIALSTKAGKEVLGLPGAAVGFLAGGALSIGVGLPYAIILGTDFVLNKIVQGIRFVLNKIWRGVTYPFRQAYKKIKGNDYNIDRIAESKKKIAEMVENIKKKAPKAFDGGNKNTEKSILRSKEKGVPSFSTKDENDNKVLNEIEVNKVLNPLLKNKIIT